MIKKELYAAPATEVLELRVEGITCTSPNTANEWTWSSEPEEE